MSLYSTNMAISETKGWAETRAIQEGRPAIY